MGILMPLKTLFSRKRGKPECFHNPFFSVSSWLKKYLYMISSLSPLLITGEITSNSVLEGSWRN